MPCNKYLVTDDNAPFTYTLGIHNTLVYAVAKGKCKVASQLISCLMTRNRRPIPKLGRCLHVLLK